MSETFRQKMIQFLETMDRNGDFSDESTQAQGMGPMTIADGVHIVSGWAMDEIGGDINRGDVLESVGTFAALHDYVDANKYGGAFEWSAVVVDEPSEDEEYSDAHCAFWSAVQHRCDVWLRAGRPEPQHLNQFLSSCELVPNISDAVNDDSAPAVNGRLYMREGKSGLYIAHSSPHLSGKWWLMLGNQQWTTDNLAVLEARLFLWAQSEGFFGPLECTTIESRALDVCWEFALQVFRSSQAQRWGKLMDKAIAVVKDSGRPIGPFAPQQQVKR